MPRTDETPGTDNDTYEPPRVERVMTAEALTREIKYAGDLPSLNVDEETG